MRPLRDTRLKKERDEEQSKIMRERLEVFRDILHKKRGTAGYDESTERLPKLVDYAVTREFRRILSTLVEKSEAREFNVKELEELMDRIEEFDAEWTNFREQRLARLFKECTGYIPIKTAADGSRTEMSDRDVLDSAIAVFKCVRCGKRMHAGDTVAHRCARRYYGSFRTLLGKPLDLYSAAIHDVVGEMRQWDSIDFRVPDITLLREAVRLCGLDPAKATAEEMMAMEAHFVVKPGTAENRIMSWDSLVSTCRRRRCYELTLRLCIALTGVLRNRECLPHF